MGCHRDQVGNRSRLFYGQVAAADLLPQDIPDLREHEVGHVQSRCVIPEQAARRIGVDLDHMPLNHNASINAQACWIGLERSPRGAHRARSSASSPSLAS